MAVIDDPAAGPSSLAGILGIDADLEAEVGEALYQVLHRNGRLTSVNGFDSSARVEERQPLPASAATGSLGS